MVFLRISSKSKAKIEKIAKILLKEKLAIDLNFKRNIERLEYVNNEVRSTKIHLITAKTRGLLFNAIDNRLIEEFGVDNMPEIYSMPIVHMDWNQAKQLPRDLREL